MATGFGKGVLGGGGGGLCTSGGAGVGVDSSTPLSGRPPSPPAAFAFGPAAGFPLRLSAAAGGRAAGTVELAGAITGCDWVGGGGVGACRTGDAPFVARAEVWWNGDDCFR